MKEIESIKLSNQNRGLIMAELENPSEPNEHVGEVSPYASSKESATPSAGDTPTTPPKLSHGFDFANAKSKKTRLYRFSSIQYPFSFCKY